MRKQEMSLRQLQERKLIVESFLSAGWRTYSNENEMFDEGLWVQREAVMEYAGSEVLLNIFYRADQNAIYISFQMLNESSVEVKIELDDRLSDLLVVIISFQDKVTIANYKDHIRSLIAVSKKIYVMDEKENFVRLTDNSVIGDESP